jgi:hypothetical protein
MHAQLFLQLILQTFQLTTETISISGHHVNVGDCVASVEQDEAD